MQNEEYRILTIFYNRLKSVLEIERPKNTHRSVFLPFFEMTANSRFRILFSSALSVINVSELIINSLLENGWIEPADELDYYCITAKGIWIIEVKTDTLNVEELIKYLGKKYFKSTSVSAKLSDKERIVILLFVSLRAFSPEICIDLKQLDTTLIVLQEVAIKCFRFLRKLDCINSLKEKDVFGKEGNEQPISNLIRHTEALPRKTKGMFNASGKQKYFINVTKNTTLESHKIAFLLGSVFGKKRINENQDLIVSFMESINSSYSIYVYKSDLPSFSSPIFDCYLKEAAEEASSN